jgi:hypothetical protein
MNISCISYYSGEVALLQVYEMGASIIHEQNKYFRCLGVHHLLKSR